MERVNIIHKISDIIENRCKGCKLIDESGAGTDGAKRKKVCDQCQYGIELKSLGDQLSGKRKGKTKVMNEKRKPGRPKKEPVVAPRMNKEAKKPFDELEKLAYELKSNNQRMKQLEDELAEKDKLIKLKTEDQAQLMKENGDLRKENDELIRGVEAAGVQEQWALSGKKVAQEKNAKLTEELSAYKEKLAKAEADLKDCNRDFEELNRLHESSLERERKLRQELNEPVNDTNREQEVEIEQLRHKIECLEKTLMCYMPNGRG